MKVIVICGSSGSGKTTLIKKILSETDYSIAVVKHTSHEHIDTEGKDSSELFKLSQNVIVMAGEETVFFTGPMDVKKVLEFIKTTLNPELVLLEGFKTLEGYTKISLDNACEGLRFDDENDILSFIKREVEIQKILETLPGYDCGKCEFETCRGMAEHIYMGEENTCDYMQELVLLRVNGKEIPLNHFMVDIFKSVLRGMVSPLKDVDNVSEIYLKIRYKH